MSQAWTFSQFDITGNIVQMAIVAPLLYLVGLNSQNELVGKAAIGCSLILFLYNGQQILQKTSVRSWGISTIPT